MKPRSILPWLLLLGLNAAAWFFFTREPAGTRRMDEAAKIHFARLAERPPSTSLVTRTNDFQWRQLESEDYKTYIERLRAIGCPEETIHDIIIADLEKLMSARVRAIDGPSEPLKYWQPSRKDLTSTLAALERVGQKQEVDFEKREIVRELLGLDLASERARAKGEQDFYDDRLGFLSIEKRGKARMLMEKANQEEMVVREKSWLESDTMSAADRAELRQIQERKEREIAALLSPEEREQFDLWFSPSAYRVREAFLALEPNEDDFLALYRLQREFDREWAAAEASDPPRAQAQGALGQAMREYLGEEKFQKLQNTRDADFRQLQAAVVQFGLKPEVTAEIYDYRTALREEKARVQSNPSFNDSQKQAVIRALSEETEQAVVEAMGPKAYRYYLRNGAGQWISDSH